jgi:hypothetical protein
LAVKPTSLYMPCEWDDWADELIGPPHPNAEREKEYAGTIGGYAGPPRKTSGHSFHAKSYRRDIHVWLIKHGSATTAEIAVALDMELRLVSDALSQMRQDKLVTAVIAPTGQGKYKTWTAVVLGEGKK